MTHVVAVDWSGRAKGASEAIWIADTDADGMLVTLESGRSRDEAIEHVIGIAEHHDRTVVGLDFAFGFPAWWAREQGWTSAAQVWAAASSGLGEEWLRECAPPFWGRPQRPNPNDPGQHFRKTDAEAVGTWPKSVFQIGGAGAVGTGSIRGMRQLARLDNAGFSIWPFASGSGAKRVAIEIYPRALTGPVAKSSWTARRTYLDDKCAEQPEKFRERAAGSEDAFDAAVSAIMMSRRRSDLTELPAAADLDRQLEGQIWTPTT